MVPLHRISSGLTKIFVAGAGLAIGLWGVEPAVADPILLGTPTDATGINGLIVDGTTYNVTFFSDTYNNVYSSSTPIFENDTALAADAMDALTGALNELNVQVLVGNSPGIQSAVIPDSPVSNDSFLGQQSVFDNPDPTWTDYPDSPIAADQTYGHNDIAVFSQAEGAPAPVPGAGTLSFAVIFAMFGFRQFWRNRLQ